MFNTIIYSRCQSWLPNLGPQIRRWLPPLTPPPTQQVHLHVGDSYHLAAGHYQVQVLAGSIWVPQVGIFSRPASINRNLLCERTKSMVIEPYRSQRCFPWCLRLGLLFLLILLTIGVAKPALAATYVITDKASCVAFGGVWTNNTYCGGSITVKAGDTLTLQTFVSFSSVTNNGTISYKGSGYFYLGALTNNGGATLSSYVLNISGTGVNYGTITTDSIRNSSPANLYIGAPFTNANGGVIMLPGNALMRLAANINNQGTILLGCGAEINYAGYTISGNPPLAADCTAPTAKPSQSPTVDGNGWTASDVTVNWNWRDNTGGSNINSANCTTRSQSSGEGVLTLTATCQDRIGNAGTASYTVKVDKTRPVANPTLFPAATAAGWNNTNVTVNWNWSDPSTGSGNSSGLESSFCPTSSTSNVGVGTQTLTALCADAVGNTTEASYTVKVDRATPQIRATVSPQSGGGGWYNQAVTVSFICDGEVGDSGIATNTVGGNVTMSSEGNYPAITNTGTCIDNAGNVATAVTVGPFKLDLTKPTISAAVTTQPNANGWYKGDVTVHFTCVDALVGIGICPDDQILRTEGSAVSSTPQTVRDRVQNSSDPSNIVTVKLDKSAPSVTVTGVTNGATYPFAAVPGAACSTTDALSGVATQATLSVTGGNGDGSGSFTATCSGATDLAGNSAAAVSVNYVVNAPTATPTDTPLPPTATPTDTPVPPTATPTDTPLPPTATPTDTPIPPTATPTDTPIPPTATPMPAADACLTTALRDDFNRADGGLGSNWGGLTDPSYFTLAGNGVDVQLGGPVVWKSTTFGVDQAAFVTLSILDGASQTQGVLLKVQEGTIPNAGALAVVYDSLAKAVRVSTLRLNNFVWTAYSNVPAIFANGDKLTGCVQADGTVRVYQNATLLTTVTLSAADQSFFNAKGGKIGLWAISAPNAVFDDFGGGALPAVTGAAVGAAALPAEVTTDGAALVVDSVLITASLPVSEPAVVDTLAVTPTPTAVPVDASAPVAPDSSEPSQRLFLPIIANALAGTVLGSPSGLGLLALVVLVSGGLIWQRRSRKR